jgi:hypothetical protein
MQRGPHEHTLAESRRTRLRRATRVYAGPSHLGLIQEAIAP